MAGVSLLWNNKMTAASGAALVMMGNGWKYGVSCGWIGTWDGYGGGVTYLNLLWKFCVVYWYGKTSFPGA